MLAKTLASNRTGAASPVPADDGPPMSNAPLTSELSLRESLPLLFSSDHDIPFSTVNKYESDSADSLTRISSHLEESSIYPSLVELGRW